MKISDLTWRVYRVPFRKPFITAHGPLGERVGVVVSLRTDAGYVGHGEIAPLPSQSGTSLDAALRALPGVAYALRGCELPNVEGEHISPNGIAGRSADRAHARGRPYYGRRICSVQKFFQEPALLRSLARTRPIRRVDQPPSIVGASACPRPARPTQLDEDARCHESVLMCGLETALLDVIGQASGQSVAALLARVSSPGKGCEISVPRASVPVNTVIGGATLEEMVTQARVAVKAGFGCLKLKIMGASEKDISRVAEVRAAIGPEPRLRLDANEGWSFEQASAILPRLAPYDIGYIEQPLPAADLAGMARLRRVSPIPLAADEALTGLESALSVLDAEAADVLILKPQLAGGLLACRDIIQIASERNVACVITSTLEAGIGVAAALHLAASSPTITLPCGLATLDLLEDDLLEDGLRIEQGCMAVPRGPGLGVTLDEDALKCSTLLL